MASKNIVKGLSKLSKRVYTLRYSSWSFENMISYETYFSRLRKKQKPSILKLASQYFMQSVLGVYRTDYGCLDVDYIIGGSDGLISAIVAIKLLESGFTVAYWPYELNDYDPYLRAWSEARSSVVPEDALKLISSELSLHSPLSYGMEGEDVLEALLKKIVDSDLSDNFIMLEASSIMEPFVVDHHLVAPAKQLDQINVNPMFNVANKCTIFSELKKGFNSGYTRRMGRVISLLRFHSFIFTSPKTRSTPRVPEDYQVIIGEAHRKTHDIDELRYSDRNEDILQALAINELIRGQDNGVS